MHKFIIIAMALLLAGCVTSSGGTMAPEAATGFLGMKSDDIKIDTAKAFAGKKDVVIGSFKVGFVTYNKASQTAGGGLMGGMAGRASAKTNLEGVSDSTMQQITDAAYADFTSLLKANGYNVVDRSTIVSTSEYKKASVETSPQRDADSVLVPKADITFFAPTGMPLHGKGFAFSSPLVAFGTLGEKTGVPVLDVEYIVNFANADGYGGSFRSTAAVNVGQGISVVPGGRVTIYGGQAGTFSNNIGSVTLGQPVFSTEEFATVSEMTTDGENALGYAANAFSAVLGGGTSISREYAVKADAGKYAAISKSVLNKANVKLVGTMKASR
ncbi:MAG: hypothetical protein DI626_06815 [Micavibrio aeruginosavorus]|uniref:Lipoprotein n=1 Tax=Micavibrio aeruginosavorus TaxID=349221 RepID=A0A2W4ZV44_9BACT|nr:MAG: hypothetical protein DI626_06815 [Micavibrio aeruginosavorus]